MHNGHPTTKPHSAEDHPVLSILRERAAAGTRPGHHDDGHTVALAVQGGAVRGVYSAAMLSALEDLGFAQAFDRMYGSSSGALNAAYSLSIGSWYPLSIYYEDLSTKKFIDFSRMLRGENLIDIDFIFDQLLETDKPLDYERILNADIDLRIAVTDVAAINAIAVGDFLDKDELKSALRASCWLPVAIKGTTTFRGREMIDGGVIVKHPARLALADADVTHVLALSTHPPGLQKAVSKRAQISAKFMLERLRPGLADAYLRGIREYDQDRLWMRHASVHATHQPYLLEIAPEPSAARIRAYDTDPHKIFHAAKGAYASACRVLLGEEVHVVPRFALAPG